MMKRLKLDPMTLLFIIVLIGVLATMTSQASDGSKGGPEITQATAQSVNISLPARY